jgi:hypothetical protein
LPFFANNKPAFGPARFRPFSGTPDLGLSRYESNRFRSRRIGAPSVGARLYFPKNLFRTLADMGPAGLYAAPSTYKYVATVNLSIWQRESVVLISLCMYPRTPPDEARGVWMKFGLSGQRRPTRRRGFVWKVGPRATPPEFSSTCNRAQMGPFRFAIWARLHLALMAIKKYDEIWLGIRARFHPTSRRLVGRRVENTYARISKLRIPAATYLR